MTASKQWNKVGAQLDKDVQFGSWSLLSYAVIKLYLA